MLFDRTAWGPYSNVRILRIDTDFPNQISHHLLVTTKLDRENVNCALIRWLYPLIWDPQVACPEYEEYIYRADEDVDNECRNLGFVACRHP